MRFVKHLTNCRRDEEMAKLIADHGVEAYGYYWLLVEVIGEAMGNTNKCEATYPLTQWAHLLHSHHHRVSKYLGKLGVTPLVRVEYVGGNIRVIILNLLKIRDDHKAKSPKTPTIDIELEKELDIEKEDNPPTPLPASVEAEVAQPTTSPKPSRKPEAIDRQRKLLTPQQQPWFEEFYKRYWRKKEPLEAAKAFGKHIRSPELWQACQNALTDQTAEMRSRDPSRIPYPASWLNSGGWMEDRQEFKPPKSAIELRKEEVARKFQERYLREMQEQRGENGNLQIYTN